MSSWYDALADGYGDWSSTSVAADVPFYVGLAREADGPLVELAVGTGRVAIPVAQATDRRVIGIDSSPAMLAQARVRAVEEGVELDLRQGDIRELEIEEPAALIYCPGRSLLHLPTWADRRRCFERVAASLRSDGRFAWNAFAFDHHVASALDDQRVDIAMMRMPDGHGRIELSRFLTPPPVADHRNAPVNALGYLRVMFSVDDLDDTLARLREHGAQLVDEVVQYKDVYRLCYVRGPEGILIGLAEQIG